MSSPSLLARIFCLTSSEYTHFQLVSYEFIEHHLRIQALQSNHLSLMGSLLLLIWIKKYNSFLTYSIHIKYYQPVLQVKTMSEYLAQVHTQRW